MSEYRRAHVPGGTFFFTIVTYERQPIFKDPANVQLLRDALAAVRTERPFDIEAGVVLPEHIHYLWTLPENDTDYSWRIGRMKVLFTKAYRDRTGMVGGAHPTESRRRHREADVWQRRFWEHVISDERDFENHLNYLHYNPVKHRSARCPHAWNHSSFQHWVKRNVYEPTWCCSCGDAEVRVPYPDDLDGSVGE